MYKSCTVFVNVSRAEEDRDAEMSAVRETQAPMRFSTRPAEFVRLEGKEREMQPHSEISV